MQEETFKAKKIFNDDQNKKHSEEDIPNYLLFLNVLGGIFVVMFIIDVEL